MDINLIRKLIKIFEESNISEMNLEEDSFKITLSKIYSIPNQANIVSSMPNIQAVEMKKEETSIQVEKSEEKIDTKNLAEIKSPIVGTFYAAPSPDAKPFIKVGDIVSAGKVVGIVEAMKLMNEIESEISGKIVKILVENATPVEYNQTLFLVEQS